MSRQLHITDEQFAAVDAILPSAADRAYARSKLEQIACNKTPPGKVAAQYERLAQQCDELALSCPPAKAAFIERVRQHARAEAASYHQIEKTGRRLKFWRECQIWALWQELGGSLGVGTGKHNYTGRAVRFFQAATKLVFGKASSPRQIKWVRSEYRKHFDAAFKARRLCDACGIAYVGQRITGGHADAEVLHATTADSSAKDGRESVG